MAEPYCLAMVLCDAVHRDPGSNKFTILGTFSSVTAPDFPVQINLCVYYAITDGLGPTTLSLQLIDGESGYLDPADEEPNPGRIFCAKSEFSFPSPLLILEGAMGVVTQLPKEGLYICELWADRVPLMSRRLVARKLDLGHAEEIK